MKAIITKYLSWTETKPSRIKVSAEGVPHRIYSNSALEKIQSDDPGERRNLHQIAAGLFAEERGWKNTLVSGGTPNPNIWCHCLVPKESQAAPVAVSDDVFSEALSDFESLLTDVEQLKAPFRADEELLERCRASLDKLLDLQPEKKPLWEVDAIQFPRLIAEAECAGLFEPGSERWDALRDEMGLESEELTELIDRAVEVWDAHKEIILGSGTPEKPVAVSVNEELVAVCRELTGPQWPDIPGLIIKARKALGLLDGPPPAFPAAPWKVIAVSSNHGSFGHKGVIVARPSGEALELTLQAYGSTPLPVEGQWLDTLPTSEVQPRKLSKVPQEIIDREFEPATAADFLKICGRNFVEVSVARENKAVREAVDGGEASAADIARIFRREF